MHGRKTARARIHIISRGTAPWYEVEIIEGRQNQIRIMFQYFGTLVEKLRRVRVGPIELGKLPPTEWRPLTPKEMYQIRAIVEKSHKPVAKRATKATSKLAKKATKKTHV